MITIWSILVAALAAGVAHQGKDALKPWFHAWWMALMATAGVTFAALIFGLLPLPVAASAAVTGAFVGLCWSSKPQTS